MATIRACQRTIRYLKENRRITTWFEEHTTSFLGVLKLAFLGLYFILIYVNVASSSLSMR